MNVQKHINKILILLTLFLTGCDDACSLKTISGSSSPNGKNIASVFERDCGATTNYVRGVSIKEVDSSGAGEEQGEEIFILEGQAIIELRWVNNSEIVVKSSGTGKTATKELKEFNGINIRYE